MTNGGEERKAGERGMEGEEGTAICPTQSQCLSSRFPTTRKKNLLVLCVAFGDFIPEIRIIVPFAAILVPFQRGVVLFSSTVLIKRHERCNLF